MVSKLKNIFNYLSLTKMGFLQQLVIVFSIGIILLTLLSTIAVSKMTKEALYERLLIEGTRITEVFAERSALALLYQSPDNAEDIAKASLAFPDVEGVSIYNTDKSVLLISGNVPDIPETELTWPLELRINYETNNHWYYASPVYSIPEDSDSPFVADEVEPELLGYVRVIMSKESLHSMLAEMSKRNIMISSALALVLLMVLFLITKRLTKPLRNLADIMHRADQGEYYIRAEVSGPKDIMYMEHAFNTMIGILEAREEEMTKARDAAIESARIKGEFAANVTHELRTPMNGVLGMLELLQDVGLTVKQNEYLDIAKNSAESLLVLIDDILDFSKVDAGKAKIVYEDFSLHELVRDVTELLSIQANSKDLYLESKLDDKIPVALKGAPTRIRQILINLIGNAIKFTETGGITVEITYLGDRHLKSNDSKQIILQFSIIDTGIGIAEDSLKSVFEPFSQVDGSSSRKYSGSGLGLAISRQLVEYLGGEIGLESEVGKGSCFWFRLDLSESSVLDLEQSNPKADEEYSSALKVNNEVALRASSVERVLPLEGKILVVEDNRTNQQVIIGMLDRLGYKLTIASSGQEAIDVVFKNDFDVILMDVQMPGMDGYETTDYIRSVEKDGPHIPIIAMTANTQQSDINHCLEVGMDDFLGKPLKLNLLQEKLEHWMSKDKKEKTVPQSSEINNEVGDTVDQSIIDMSIYAELQENIGAVFEEMIRVYLEDLPQNLSVLQKSLKENDFKSAARAAHTLKGCSRSFGALKFGELCKQMEEFTRSENKESAEQLLGQVIDHADLVKNALLNNPDEPADNKKRSTEKTTETILVVDDQRDMRMAIRSVLEQDGYQIEEAGTGKHAIAICKRKMPELILMDAIMPEMDGFIACQQIQMLPDGSHIPILIVTALDDASSIEKAFSVGATDYIAKPVNFKVLRKRIARLLDASSAQRHVRHLAYHDPLTNLPNRTTFTKRLEKLIQAPKTDGKMLAVMFIDLDRFKLVNDTLGHGVGDLLLKIAAERLSSSVRESDMVARLGGDEFTIILDNIASTEIVMSIAEKICKRMSEPFSLMDQKLYVTTSIGISVFPIDGNDANELIKHADTAMFRAKEKRDGYQFYELGMESLVAKRMHMENEIRKAIDQDEFILHYQPQIDLFADRVAGMEALIRWQHPERGMVPPSEFIPLAEESGLISELGEWVLIHSCQQLKEWLNRGYSPLRLAVNLSGRQLEDNNLTQKVASILEETGVPASLLELEITESAIMKNPDEAIPVLEELKNMGITLAIDDFGTGHSSLNYLRKFPVDTLKIDRSFVNDITTSAEDAAIISGIIALAKSLDLMVVAEGVETFEQKKFLKDCKCEYIQGFYMYKPMPADIFEHTICQKLDINQATNF